MRDFRTRDYFEKGYTDSELKLLRQSAEEFFQNHFGFSKNYIRRHIMSYRFNPNIPSIHAEFNTPISNMGWGLKVMPGTTLDGVFVCTPSVIGYGIYDIPGQYKIIYKTMVPLKKHTNTTLKLSPQINPLPRCVWIWLVKHSGYIK